MCGEERPGLEALRGRLGMGERLDFSPAFEEPEPEPEPDFWLLLLEPVR